MTSTLQGNLPEVEPEINKPRTKPFAALCHRPRVFILLFLVIIDIQH